MVKRTLFPSASRPLANGGSAAVAVDSAAASPSPPSPSPSRSGAVPASPFSPSPLGGVAVDASPGPPRLGFRPFREPPRPRPAAPANRARSWRIPLLGATAASSHSASAASATCGERNPTAFDEQTHVRAHSGLPRFFFSLQRRSTLCSAARLGCDGVRCSADVRRHPRVQRRERRAAQQEGEGGELRRELPEAGLEVQHAVGAEGVAREGGGAGGRPAAWREVVRGRRREEAVPAGRGDGNLRREREELKRCSSERAVAAHRGYVQLSEQRAPATPSPFPRPS